MGVVMTSLLLFRGDRYDAVRVCLGGELLERLANLRLFMVCSVYCNMCILFICHFSFSSLPPLLFISPSSSLVPFSSPSLPCCSCSLPPFLTGPLSSPSPLSPLLPLSPTPLSSPSSLPPLSPTPLSSPSSLPPLPPPSPSYPPLFSLLPPCSPTPSPGGLWCNRL